MLPGKWRKGKGSQLQVLKFLEHSRGPLYKQTVRLGSKHLHKCLSRCVCKNIWIHSPKHKFCSIWQEKLLFFLLISPLFWVLFISSRAFMCFVLKTFLSLLVSAGEVAGPEPPLGLGDLGMGGRCVLAQACFFPSWAWPSVSSEEISVFSWDSVGCLYCGWKRKRTFEGFFLVL